MGGGGGGLQCKVDPRPGKCFSGPSKGNPSSPLLLFSETLGKNDPCFPLYPRPDQIVGPPWQVKRCSLPPPHAGQPLAHVCTAPFSYLTISTSLLTFMSIEVSAKFVYEYRLVLVMRIEVSLIFWGIYGYRMRLYWTKEQVLAILTLLQIPKKLLYRAKKSKLFSVI